MELRRRILKFLLASLALAAIAGVLAVLLPTREVMIKVMLTGLATAIAAALMIALTFMLGRLSTRPGGLYGMSAFMAMFVLCLATIWLTPLLRSRTEEKLGLTILVIGLTTLPLLVYLSLVRWRRTRVAAVAGAGFAWAALILYLLAIWLPGNMWNHEPWWVTAWTVGGYGMIVFVCLLDAGFSLHHAWRWGGAVCGLLGMVTLIVMAWDRDRSGPELFDVLEKVLCVLTSVAVVVGLANGTLLPSLKPGQRWVRVGTIVAAAATALWINVLVLGEGWADEEFFGRLVAATGIVTACGSLAVIVLAALNRRGAIEPSTAALLEMVVICPICRTKQTTTTGASSCRGCGLRMEIKLEEPRCPHCDYLLYRLASDRCPECGATVRPGG